MREPVKKDRSGQQVVLLTVLCVVLALILIAMIFVTAYAKHMLGLIGRTQDHRYDTLAPGQTLPPEGTRDPNYTGPVVDPTDVTLDTDSSQLIKSEHLVNILLIGQDRRPGENYLTRSDAMILCTFNKKDKTITMTSFLRDLYVQIPGRGPEKLNAAYAYGGMPLLRGTMELNFGVYVDACVEVDFSNFTKVVDAVGGVSITLTEQEARYMNRIAGYSLHAGSNILNGEQALTYSRIREIGTDFGRTERQRKVLTAVINKAKRLSLSQALDMLNQLLPMLTTDITDDAQIIRYVTELFPLLSGGELRALRIPVDGAYEDVKAIGNLNDVLVPDLEANRKVLRDYLLPGNG